MKTREPSEPEIMQDHLSAHPDKQSFDIYDWLQNTATSSIRKIFKHEIFPLIKRYGVADDDAHVIYHYFTIGISHLTKTGEKLILQSLRDMNDLLNVLLTNGTGLSFVHDILAIYCFLRNEKECYEALDQLETAFQAYATEHASIPRRSQPDGRFFIPNANVAAHNGFKIFSGYLYSWGKIAGFTSRATILATLSPDDFQALLASKTIFKDSSPDLPLTHGRWAHTVQWWCIFNYLATSGRLQHAPMDIYQQFGRMNPVIWNKVFDRSENAMRFFTSPEYVTGEIMANELSWPILGGTVSRQFHKQLVMDSIDPQAYRSHMQDKYKENFDQRVIKVSL